MIAFSRDNYCPSAEHYEMEKLLLFISLRTSTFIVMPG